MIRETTAADVASIMAMVEGSGQFDAAGLAHVRTTLEQYLVDGGDEIWLTADDGEPVGVAYCAPEPVTLGTWNLLMLWTRDDRHGRGHGSQLVQHLETILTARKARLLIVETSGLPDFAAARAFYGACGFAHEATVKNFFDDGDHKLILTKTVAEGAA